MTDDSNIDQATREKALDITQSFIVQAPAGSGKTTLLLKRFLKALLNVKEPKKVLGMTFTKKAAEEMKMRLLNALDQQCKDTALLKLAKKVLNHAKKHHWENLEQQINIVNIDSFAKQIITQTPLYNKAISEYKIANDVQMKQLIIQSIENAFFDPKLQQDWSEVFQMFHHDSKSIEASYIQMIKTREQWIECILKIPKQSNDLNKHLTNWLVERSKILANQLEKNIHSSDWQIIQQLLEQHPKYQQEAFIHNFKKNLHPENYSIYQKISEILLTNDAKKTRSRWTKNEGFSDQSSLSKQLQKELKSHLKKLSEKINQSNILFLFQEYFHFPKTNSLSNSKEHQKLLAVKNTLLATYSELELLMHEKRQCDFTKINQVACQTLKSYPFMHLQTQIEHLLIDEFQDTSMTHWKMIKTLIENWDLSQNKSLFLVGDPMQSIYQFREAKPHLFIQGTLGELLENWPIKHLILKSNFRSDHNLVKKNNTLFSRLMPKDKDALTSSINFEESVGYKKYPEFLFQCHLLEKNSLKETLRNILENLDENAQKKLTILAKKNSMLSQIGNCLDELGLQHQTHNTKQSTQHIEDLILIFKSLTNPFDKLSWIGMLRSPFIGLKLNDIFQIHQTKGQSTYEKWQHALEHQSLSEDGIQRSQILFPNIRHLIEAYHQISLTDWLAKCFKKLNLSLIPKKLFFQLTEQIHLEQNTTSINFSELQSQMTAHLRPTENINTGAINLISMHGAKGLEFEHVITVGAYEKTPASANTPFLWLVEPKEETLILGAYNREKQKNVYQYIQYIKKYQEKLEQHRLFYVACSRAKKTLHIIESKNTLEQLNLPFQDIQVTKQLSKAEEKLKYTRIKINDLAASSTTFKSSEIIKKTPYSILQKQKKLIGEMIHEILEQWGRANCLYALDDQKINHLIKKYYIPKSYQQWAKQILKTCIQKMINDPNLHWIIVDQKNAHSEWPLIDQKKLMRIDRCFFDQQKYWIIDYKTLFNTLDDKTIQKQYQTQLQGYANALHAIKKQPIELGIYLTQNQKFIHWSFKTSKS